MSTFNAFTIQATRDLIARCKARGDGLIGVSPETLENLLTAQEAARDACEDAQADVERVSRWRTRAWRSLLEAAELAESLGGDHRMLARRIRVVLEEA